MAGVICQASAVAACRYKKLFTYWAFGVFMAVTMLGGAEAVAADELLKDGLTFRPARPDGIYNSGERVSWRVGVRPGAGMQRRFTYTIKRNNWTEIAAGEFEVAEGKDAEIAVAGDAVGEPGMLLVEIRPAEGAGVLKLGAAISPTKIAPAVDRPVDFREFWDAKIAELKTVPENITWHAKESGKSGVTYKTFRMDGFRGSGVHGQWARPEGGGRRPAVVIFQWASPPYPLQKQWVTDWAAKGWLAVNVQPHDVPVDGPPELYAGLPAEIKNYQSIGVGDREKNYFLGMYLNDLRVVEYLSKCDDWDGKTLVMLGTSMGGQQAIAMAGLHPSVTHLIVNEPAGCDMNGPKVSRAAGYPNFPVNRPEVAKTAEYFDAVNFAMDVRATSLVAMGFIDNIVPPAGIWAAYNQIKGEKEAAPMPESAHNHQATAEQQRPFTSRAEAWMEALAAGRAVEVRVTADGGFDDQAWQMKRLGISRLRGGADPNNQEVFSEATAHGWMNGLPKLLDRADGGLIADAVGWREKRTEILAAFEREVYGRVPPAAPDVAWRVVGEEAMEIAGKPVVLRRLIGRAERAEFPAGTVEIEAGVVLAAGVKDQPVVIEFGTGRRWRQRGQTTQEAATQPVWPTWWEQAISRGWGCGYIVPRSIQPDSRDVHRGIIGLVAGGKPRGQEDWGAIRAWAWGFSRLVDELQRREDWGVDGGRIAVAGLSRYGKAALVTLAYDERVWAGLVGSSGEGGTKLSRRRFGEQPENIAGGASFWMAGNYLKYSSEDPRRTVQELPVDAHGLIAACAPRRCFISYGVVEKGDAKWVDARGSYMAGVLAGQVYELLGEQAFGGQWRGRFLESRPPEVGVLEGGRLAWRQHDGGHELTQNWQSFLDWAVK